MKKLLVFLVAVALVSSPVLATSLPERFMHAVLAFFGKTAYMGASGDREVHPMRTPSTPGR